MSRRPFIKRLSKTPHLHKRQIGAMLLKKRRQTIHI